MEIVNKEGVNLIRHCAECETDDESIERMKKRENIRKVTSTLCIDCIHKLHPGLFTDKELEEMDTYKVIPTK